MSLSFIRVIRLINYPHQNNMKEKGICLLSIGQVIEFLGHDLDSGIEEINRLEWKRYKELVDILWEGVKNKLKQ